LSDVHTPHPEAGPKIALLITIKEYAQAAVRLKPQIAGSNGLNSGKNFDT